MHSGSASWPQNQLIAKDCLGHQGPFVTLRLSSQGSFPPHPSQSPAHLAQSRPNSSDELPSPDSSSSDSTTSSTVKIRRPRAILSEAEVREIYDYKVSNKSVSATRRMSSPTLAKVYGVGEKTIRDIWNGRTWSRKTSHPRSSRLENFGPKHIGRPKGSKDMKPRKQRRRPDQATSNPQLESLLDGAPAAHLMDARRLSAQIDLSWDVLTFTEKHDAIHNNDNDAGKDLRNDLRNEFADPFHQDWAHWGDQD